MVSLSDLINGPKVFEDNFGTTWGPRLWRGFFVIALLAVVAFCLTEIGGFGKAVFSNVSGLFRSEPVNGKIEPKIATKPLQLLPQPSFQPLPQPNPKAEIRPGFTGKTVEELWRQCAERTQIQCDILVADDKGKSIDVDGPVSNVSSGGEKLYVSLHIGPNIGQPTIVVSCIFGEKWKPRLTIIRQGDAMKLVGKIDGVRLPFLDLVECELRD